MPEKAVRERKGKTETKIPCKKELGLVEYNRSRKRKKNKGDNTMNNDNNRKEVKDRILEAAEKIEKCISILESATTKHPNPSAEIVKFLEGYFIKKKSGRNKPS